MTLILPHDLVDPASSGANRAGLCFWTPDRFGPLLHLISLSSKPGVPTIYPNPKAPSEGGREKDARTRERSADRREQCSRGREQDAHTREWSADRREQRSRGRE